jgi:hypothetical protein
MNQALKFAAAAAAIVAATGAYASQDDARPDNAWIAKDVATIHMEPQVIISAAELPQYSPYSFSAAPAPTAAAAYSTTTAVPSADGGTMIEQTTVTYYTVPPAIPTSPMVFNSDPISPNA